MYENFVVNINIENLKLKKKLLKSVPLTKELGTYS